MSEEEIIEVLEDLNSRWNRDYILFSNNGDLQLWKGHPIYPESTLIKQFSKIHSDGGGLQRKMKETPERDTP